MNHAVGTIGWLDLTVDDAPALRDFYREVVGWSATELAMDGYSDYVMSSPESGDAVAGVCHARGGNAGLPACWLVYVTVADLDRSLDRVTARGGAVVGKVRTMPGQGRYAVITDPTGAALALFEHER